MVLSIHKAFRLILIAFFLGFGLSLAFPMLVTSPHIVLPLKMPTILLDPGHGGWDGGTHDFQGLKEKDVVLQFGFLLKAELEKYDFLVKMTRTTDRELSEFAPYQGTRQRTDLLARVNMITQHQADLFISIHVNAAPNRNLCGGITFYQRKSKKSKTLAQSIQTAVKEVQLYNNQTILPGNFYLLNCAPVPSVLLELAFITHNDEHRLLQDPIFLQQMAEEVARSILNYTLQESRKTFSFHLF